MPASSQSSNESTERNTALFVERTRLIDLERDLVIGRISGSPSSVKNDLKRTQFAIEKVTNEIIESNMGLVVSCVSIFTRTSPPHLREEYRAVAVVALVEAINSYRADAGPFAAWATLAIKREVQKAVRREEHPMLGQRDFEQRPLVNDQLQQSEFAGEPNPPSAADVADSAALGIDQVKRILASQPIVSLESEHVSDGYASRKSQRGYEDNSDLASEEQTWVDHLAMVTEDLTILEVYVLIRREGLDGWPPATLQWLASHLGIGRETLRQHELEARRKILAKGFPIPRRLE